MRKQRINRVLKIQKRNRHTYFLSCGSFIPHEWNYVKPRIVRETKDKVIVEFKRVKVTIQNGGIINEVKVS